MTVILTALMTVALLHLLATIVTLGRPTALAVAVTEFGRDPVFHSLFLVAFAFVGVLFAFASHDIVAWVGR